MKPFIFGAIALAAVALGGCNIGGTTVTVPTADQVVAATQQACGYLPVIASIEPVLQANPTITNATQLANLICTALKSVPPVASHHPGVAVEKDLTIVVDGKTYVIKGSVQ